MTIEIFSPASDNNFHYSYTHTAVYSDPSGKYYYGGTATAALRGQLTGHLSAGILTITGGELLRMAKPSGLVPLNRAPYTRIIGRMRLSGVLDFNGQHLDDESVLGSLAYETFDPVGNRNGSGSWYFVNRDFSAAVHKPNNLHANGNLRLWGNNFHLRGPAAIDDFKPGPGYLGVDLGGAIVTQPIPEPTSVILFVAGTAIVGGAVYRRRRDAADSQP